MASRSVSYVLVVAALLAAIASVATAADWLSVGPAGYESMSNVTVDGKQLPYYRFSAEAPLRFAVDGPTRVKVLVRLRVPMNASESSCAFDVVRDGAASVAESLSASASERAYYVSLEDFRPSVLRRIYVDVPTGRHGYEVRPRGRYRADARVFRSADEAPSLASLAPREYARAETFLHKDSELVYYMASTERGVVLDVVGPTSIKVNSRLVYDKTMTGGQTYMLGVTRDGGEEMLYKVETRPSETVAFRDREDLVPGALRYFMLEVPSGRHSYEFRVADALASGVALKFYIPRGDLLNEP